MNKAGGGIFADIGLPDIGKKDETGGDGPAGFNRNDRVAQDKASIGIISSPDRNGRRKSQPNAHYHEQSRGSVGYQRENVSLTVSS